MAMNARFSFDHTSMAFVGSDNKFLSHSGNYQLKYIKWTDGKPGTPETAIDYRAEYPSDQEEFCGLFGYQMTYTHANFLGKNNNFFVFESEFKGQGRLYVTDLAGNIKWLNFLKKDPSNYREGHYSLLRLKGNMAVVYFSSCNQPAQIYLLNFTNIDSAESVSDLDFEATLIEENEIHDEHLA